MIMYVNRLSKEVSKIYHGGTALSCTGVVQGTSSTITYYGCGQKGHIKRDCPKQEYTTEKWGQYTKRVNGNIRQWPVVFISWNQDPQRRQLPGTSSCTKCPDNTRTRRNGSRYFTAQCTLGYDPGRQGLHPDRTSGNQQGMRKISSRGTF